jgi:hypothetical protein
VRRLLPLACLAALGCEDVIPPTPAAEPGLFDHPQAVLFVGDRLVVGNTGYDPADWRRGSLIVLDATDLSFRAQIWTARENPQRLVAHADRLFVVETGILDFSDFDAPRAATPGAIEAFALDGLERGARAGLLELDVGPIDFAARDERAVFSSALVNSVWGLNLARPLSPAALSGPTPLTTAAPLGLGAVRPWREGFVIVDFNSDSAHLLDPAGVPTGCSVHLGESDAVEGAQSPWVEGDALYVILAFAGVVRRVDLGALSVGCVAPVETVVPALGQVPNDLHLRGEEIFVVHSADNNVVVYGLADGRERRRYVLGRGANPWHAAFSPDGRLMAVTEWAGQGLSVFDLASGQVRRVGASP